jgi:hypothetical protein
MPAGGTGNSFHQRSSAIMPPELDQIAALLSNIDFASLLRFNFLTQSFKLGQPTKKFASPSPSDIMFVSLSLQVHVSMTFQRFAIFFYERLRARGYPPYFLDPIFQSIQYSQREQFLSTAIPKSG